MMSRLVRASLIAGVVMAATPALAQTKWNLPAAYPADNPHSENLVAFAKDVEAAIKSAEAFLYAASAILLIRRLAR